MKGVNMRKAKSSYCAKCKRLFCNCEHLDFENMPVVDGTINEVICTSFDEDDDNV